MSRMKIFLLTLIFLTTTPWLTMAATGPDSSQDDVISTINEAVKQYKAGDFAGAASNLDYASQLVRQKKSEKMKELLPGPLKGWTAKPAVAQAVGAAILGGGVTVSREYHKGAAALTIEIVSDSPVLQSVIMMMKNPLFAGAGGGKLQTINGQRGLIKYDQGARRGELNIVIQNRFMISIKGEQVTRDDLLAYARAIDFHALEQN